MQITPELLMVSIGYDSAGGAFLDRHEIISDTQVVRSVGLHRAPTVWGNEALALLQESSD
ncbi:hypothetical protein JYU34_016578 [Plutella xylostella]|uniref:Uncharacterized protein n=1 Tax=Plutella xylostella TaxID=51655 RepID=A0ABQ7Q2Y7_PLUXY|nr:hypothetical protein JYU34_016578 [Plutella xylostella]